MKSTKKYILCKTSVVPATLVKDYGEIDADQVDTIIDKEFVKLKSITTDCEMPKKLGIDVYTIYLVTTERTGLFKIKKEETNHTYASRLVLKTDYEKLGLKQTDLSMDVVRCSEYLTGIELPYINSFDYGICVDKEKEEKVRAVLDTPHPAYQLPTDRPDRVFYKKENGSLIESEYYDWFTFLQKVYGYISAPNLIEYKKVVVDKFWDKVCFNDKEVK